MDYLFEYKCPHCGVKYIGSIEPPNENLRKEETCEDCGKKFILDVFLEVLVSTEKKVEKL